MSDQEVSLPTELRPAPAPAGGRGHSPHAAEVYADVPNRLVALAIDAVLLSAIVLVGAIAVSLTVGPVVRIEGSSIAVDREIAVVDALLSTLLGALYFAGSWVRFGATPGQRLLGIRVVRASDGRPVTLTAALVRWLLLAAPLGVASVLTTAVVAGRAEALVDLALVVWYVALLVSTARSPVARGLHDRSAGTAVTRPARRVEWEAAGRSGPSA